MPIPVAAISEPYAALTILRQSQLNTAIGDNVSGSVEFYLNTNVRNNLNQLALDVFGATYDYTNDGVAAFATPLTDLAARLADNETVTGTWTFSAALTFSSTVTSSSTFTSSGQMRARAYISGANQNIGNSATTALNFNTETYDVGTMHDVAVNTNRITVPASGAGIYVIDAQVTFAANVTGRREVYIFKNGSQIAEVKEPTNSATEETTLQISCHDNAAAADYYEVQVFQNSGGGLDVVLGERITYFSAMKVW